MFKAIILEDSEYNGSRLTTFQISLPKYLLQEFNTHRMFSRNFSSSRAIPLEKNLENCSFTPVYFGVNKSGMQSDNEVDEETKKICEYIWEDAKLNAKSSASVLFNKGDVHKQVCNRLVEPFAWAHGVVTATNFDNFFMLRAEKSAEPNICYEATLMGIEFLKSKPKKLTAGDWHIPFIREEEKTLSLEDQKIMSVARCARSSYNNFYGKNDFESDKKLFNLLKESGHWSPFEHQAEAGVSDLGGNFGKYWKQHRKTVEPVEKDFNLQQRIEEMKELCKSRGYTFE